MQTLLLLVGKTNGNPVVVGGESKVFEANWVVYHVNRFALVDLPGKRQVGT